MTFHYEIPYTLD